MSSSPNLINVSELRFGYEKAKIALEVDAFSVSRDELAVIVGPNGSGKSTLCKLLAGILAPRRGSIHVPGKPPILVWQSLELFPGTVEHNLRVVSPDRARVEDLLHHFHLSNLRGTFVGDLSGGEARRLAIARAVAASVDRDTVLILDEPTSSIDPSYIDDIAMWIKNVGDMVGARVVVTHDPRLLSLLAQESPQIYTLEPRARRDAQITQSALRGPMAVAGLFVKPESLYAAEFAGYENMFQVFNPERPIDPHNLRALPRDNVPTGISAVVIPYLAVAVQKKQNDGSVPVKFVSRECRSGGLCVLRYRWEAGGGETLDFVLAETVDTAMDLAFLTIDEQKCIRIQA